jgi:PAS domain S-box-containing protein
MEFNNKPLDILIVEDNTGDVMLLKEVLFDTQLAINDIKDKSDLSSSIQYLKSFQADIIFLDLSLPDKTGLDTFLNLQQHAGQIPIVILTGLDDTRLAVEAINKGAQDFLIKGDVDEKVLTKTILYSIERKRISESLRISNERYDLVSKATNDMVWDWDLQNHRVYRSRTGWSKLFRDRDYEESKYPDSWWDRVHPDDKAATTAIIQDVLNNKDVNNFEIECRISTDNGNYANVIDRGYAIRNERGEAIRLIGATQDITDKKLAEEELKRLSLIAQETSNAVVITNQQGIIQWVNESFEKITGYTLHDVNALRLIDFFEKANASELVLRYMRRKLFQQKAFECDLLISSKSFQNCWLRIQCQPQLQQNQLTSFFAIITDISKVKEAEEKLIASEKRFRSIIENSNEGLVQVDTRGVSFDISPAGKKILGHTEEGNFWLMEEDLIYHEDREYVEKIFLEVVNLYNNVKIIEFRIKRADGKYIWIEATFHNLLHEVAIGAVVIHFRDISSRKLFEEVLKSSEEKYRNLFNNNPAAIFIWDPQNFSIIEVNDAAVKEYGYSRAEFKRLPVNELVAAKELADFKNLAKNIITNQDFKATGTWQHVTKHGVIKSMEITFQAIDYYGKNASLAIANNISDKVELEKKLADERLKKQQDITAAAIIAQEHEREDLGKELHDNINQILATTKLYIEYALANDEMRVSLLNSAKEFVASAVTELRNLSKSLLPPSLGEVGLLMALDELLESIRLVNQFNLTSEWDKVDENLLNEQLKLTVFRIIQEQLNNIIKHAQAKNVSIKIKTLNKRLMVDIKDDGVGFVPSDKRKGVGLKNITSRAELHNGVMQLKSAPGQGCELSLLFRL